MNIRLYTHAALVSVITAILLLTGCEKIPTDTATNLPPIQPGGGAKIGCGMIMLKK